MVLNDLELCIVSVKAMRFTEDEALAYLATQGFKISVRTYYYTLGNISSAVRQRAFEHAKNFLEDHINTIDELLNIKKLMYREFVKESDPIKKTMILAKIVETMIPYISAYKEATKRIIEKIKKEVGNEENIDLSSLGA